MRVVSQAEAAGNLEELFQAAERGEAVYIERGEGRKSIRLNPVTRPTGQLDMTALATFRATLPYQELSTAELIEEMRDRDLDRF